MALGMMPNTPWDGILTSLGGFLLVKQDGDVLCYYLYNLKDFQEYLFEKTKFDTPSTTRYGIGSVINKNGRAYIKLNLQVRFYKIVKDMDKRVKKRKIKPPLVVEKDRVKTLDDFLHANKSLQHFILVLLGIGAIIFSLSKKDFQNVSELQSAIIIPLVICVGILVIKFHIFMLQEMKALKYIITNLKHMCIFFMLWIFFLSFCNFIYINFHKKIFEYLDEIKISVDQSIMHGTDFLSAFV